MARETPDLEVAVWILIGQRPGSDRADLAERSTYTGLKWVVGYMSLVAASYLLILGVLISIFEGNRDPQGFEAVAVLVPL